MYKKFALLLAPLMMFLLCSCSINSKISASDISEEFNAAHKMISIEIADLVEIKDALNSFDSEGFLVLLKEKYPEFIMNGMTDYETSVQIISEIERTVLPIPNGIIGNVPEMHFYVDRNEIQQIIFFGEESRIVFNIYTPESARLDNGQYGPNSSSELLKTEKGDDFTANIYFLEDEGSFCADLVSSDTYMFLRTADITSVDEFSSILHRLKFVEIGDILDGTYGGDVSAETRTDA